ncbi:F0F1 ATP synthase subunit alpha [Candidatus Beckwithbacteria bacterium CG10_big_fil_rev_8_21_14_0_10_34_10]|uniref:ATP synthase subunit alpha n=1 Tax=Candidatus Beckwithbacteria bacterium CG10_big_fil_rev_8_21_14_0_10_34_10 TaxID=1974495 RepID=A0A2H0WB31_9BACT|nr:MAG: F0F1 ATP synthase subunit alpha [Candidatus Beckwithbacteria bacterium CG10_big_fil_rev_8_21_14_0_10_34_10]
MKKTNNKIKTSLNYDHLFKDVDHFKPETAVYDFGKILSIGDGIAKISGLPQAMYNEIIAFPNNIYGLVFNLEEKVIGAIVLGDDQLLKEGDEVRTTGKILQVPVSDSLIGRVINPLGKPLDNKPLPKSQENMPLETIAPGVIERQSVNTPLQTGIKAIDSIIPIGRGQRELILGDRGIGKTALAIDTIINQKGKDVICIYVAIGQKASRIAKIIEKLKSFEALNHTIIVTANASDPASLQYLAPYSGCAIAEYFMNKKKDVLVVYDDLSKHAWAYRQLSLLMRRPSSREAYPGDIFYLHSRLLERACRLNDKNGGGSITALPIIETQAGDLSAYIPTNVISITDGQIHLETDLFFAGIRPAINPGLSVSRVGGSAQVKGMKKVAGKLKLDLSQYRELAAFAQFSTDLDPETKKIIDRGSRLIEILKQGENQPVPVEDQIIILWAATKGFLDKIEIKKIREFEKAFLDHLKSQYLKTVENIRTTKDLDPKIEKDLEKAILKLLPDFEIKEEVENNEKNENSNQLSQNEEITKELKPEKPTTKKKKNKRKPGKK